MSAKPRVLLIAEESAGLQVLKSVAERPCELVAVMTSSPEGRVSLSAAAERLGYPVWPAQLVKDPAFAHQVSAECIDLILNVHSRYLIQDDVLSAPRIGAFNLHPGLLPEYAGLNTVSWAIYLGAKRFGVTLHWMAPRIDAGHIAYCSSVPVEENDTPLSLMHKCVKAGIPLVSELLECARTNPSAIPKIQQNLSRRRYFGKNTPEDGRLLWAQPAANIRNFVRACDYFPFPSPWAHPKAQYRGKDVRILKAERTNIPCGCRPGTVGDSAKAGTHVATLDEWLLVRKLLVDGSQFHPDELLRPGSHLEDGV